MINTFQYGSTSNTAFGCNKCDEAAKLLRKACGGGNSGAVDQYIKTYIGLEALETNPNEIASELLEHAPRSHSEVASELLEYVKGNAREIANKLREINLQQSLNIFSKKKKSHIIQE